MMNTELHDDPRLIDHPLSPRERARVKEHFEALLEKHAVSKETVEADPAAFLSDSRFRPYLLLLYSKHAKIEAALHAGLEQKGTTLDEVMEDIKRY